MFTQHNILKDLNPQFLFTQIYTFKVYVTMLETFFTSVTQNIHGCWTHGSLQNFIHHFTHTTVISGSPVAYPGIFFGGGSTNSAEDREKGDLGALAP
jgi:hypothetical protein